MFDFTTKPKPPHNRSKSSPYSPYSAVEPSDVLSAPPVAFISSNPNPSHQRTLTTLSQSGHQLPPLITRKQGDESPKAGAGLRISLFSNPDDISFDLSPDQSPRLSPTKEKWSFLPNFSLDKNTEPRAESKGLNLAEWFQGESAPVNLGIISSPTKEKVTPAKEKASPAKEKVAPMASPPNLPSSMPPKKLQRKRTSSPSRSPAPASSRFTFFASKVSSPSPSRQPAPPTDELLQLDIRAALRPHVNEDPFSPSAFKNLLQNAEGILNKFQKAYRERTLSLQEATSEKEAQEEELEEAQTRARHLKLQLDDMAAKMLEQDTMMMNLIDELAREKQARREEAEVRMRSVRLVDPPSTRLQTHRRSRLSSTSTVSDSGFESNDESHADSVFDKSGAYSPSMSLNSASSIESMHFADACHDSGFSPAAPSKLRSLPQPTSAAYSRPEAPRTSCSNCQGVKASEAWSVLGVLKEENHGLKQRVSGLEASLDDCLDLVHGLGI